MKTTGERFIPNAQMGEEIELEHMHRYYAALPFVKNKVVLDAACGVGYGSKILSDSAKKVIGIDIDPETIDYAKQNNNASNVSYQVMSIEEMAFPDSYFDVVVSFETIEHVTEEIQHAFLDNISRILKPEGILIISTPDRDFLLKKTHGKYQNPFHIKEYSKAGFISFLKEYFPFVSIQLQEKISCSLISSASLRIINESNILDEGSFIIAICSKFPIDSLQGSIFLPTNHQDSEVHAYFYPNYGDGVFEKEKCTAFFHIDPDGAFETSFNLERLDRRPKSLRFDPCDFPSEISLSCINENGDLISIKPQNSTFTKGAYDVFMHSDPFYLIDLSDNSAFKEIIIKGKLQHIDQSDVDLFWLNKLKNHEQQFSVLNNSYSDLSKQYSKKCEEYKALSDIHIFKNTEYNNLSEIYLKKSKSFDDLSSLYTKKCNDFDVLSVDYNNKCGAFDELSADYLNKCNEFDELSTGYLNKCNEFDELSADYLNKCNEFDELSAGYLNKCNEFDELSADYIQKSNEYEKIASDYLEKCSAFTDLSEAYIKEKSNAESYRLLAFEANEALSQNQARSLELEQDLQSKNKAIADYGAIVNQLNADLSQAQDAFNQISNATFWKITAPARHVCEIIRSSLKKLHYPIHLLRRALTVFRSNGITGVIEKYHAFKKRGRPNDLSVHASTELSCFRNIDSEPIIPEGWITIQPKHPKISIILAIKNIPIYKKQIIPTLDSLNKQVYKNFELILSFPNSEANEVHFIDTLPYSFKTSFVSVMESDSIEDYWDAAMDKATGEYICILEQTERLVPNALAYLLDGFNEFPDAKLFLLPDDCYLNDGDYFSQDFKDGVGLKIGGVEALIHVSAFKHFGYRFKDHSLDNWLLSLKKEDIYLVPWISCHKELTINDWQAQNVREIAFYLPQFHEIPENNEWWGKGFTEWTNVKKAKPLYPGHHQPRIPGELGYYDLGDQGGIEVQKRQIALAKEYGLSGFCYYYYWFDGGKRLLEKPLDRHLKNESLDFPFCLCWANENWTRRWDGLQNEILMPQSYEGDWAYKFIYDLLPYLKDDRYIKVNGAPYILIYNIAEIPNAGDAINIWRKVAAENGISRLHISAVRRTVNADEFSQSNNTIDSLTDFPPHLLGIIGVDHDQEDQYGLNPGQVKDYRKASNYHSKMTKQNYAYFRTAMLEWDNTARRGQNATVFEDYSINEYKKWLYSAKRYTLRQNFPGEDLVFINAWNEWCEGTYLEPSKSNGREALEATLEVSKIR